jgi:hypothetical protein
VISLERRPVQPAVRRRLLAFAEFDDKLGHAPVSHGRTRLSIRRAANGAASYPLRRESLSL